MKNPKTIEQINSISYSDALHKYIIFLEKEILVLKEQNSELLSRLLSIKKS